MEYLCIKQLCIGGKVYYPGDILPDGAILPERVAKLSKSGYISALPESTKDPQSPVSGTVYTQEELEQKVAEAVEKALADAAGSMEGALEMAEPLQVDAADFDGLVIVPVRMESNDGQQMALPMTPDQIIKVLTVMQMNVEEGTKAIAEIEDEDVLTLLHAADSRVTVKNAVKKRIGNINSAEDALNAPNGGSSFIEGSMDTGYPPESHGGGI